MIQDMMRTLSQTLIDLKNDLPEDKVCTFDLVERLHERGIGMLLFIFALPAALPIPALGINVIIALPLLLLTAQQAMGRHSVWIPEKIKYKSISRAQFEKFLNSALPFVKKLEILVKPRMEFVTQGVFSRMVGFAGLIMALSVCVPLPLTNTVPSFGIALMALGVLTRDGLAVLTGMMIGLAWVTLLVFVIGFIGIEGLDLIKETIKSYLL